MGKKIYSGIKTNVKSLSFLLAVLLVALLCGFNEVFTGEVNQPTVWEVFFTASAQEMQKLGDMFHLIYIVEHVQELQWFAILFPVLAAFPSVYGFADEWMTGNYYMTVSRCGYFGYTLRALLTAALTGVLTVMCGILLFAAIISLRIPVKETEIDGRYFLNLFLNAGVASMVAILLVAVFRDRFFALCLPMTAVYLGMKLDEVYMRHLFIQYGFDGYPVSKMVPTLFNPYWQLSMDATFTAWFKLPYYWYCLYMFAIMGILAAVLYSIVKRRNG